MYLCKSHESSRLLKIFIGRETLPFSLEWVKLTFVSPYCLRGTMDGWMKETVSWVNKQLFQQSPAILYSRAVLIAAFPSARKMLNQYTVSLLSKVKSLGWNETFIMVIMFPPERLVETFTTHHVARLHILISFKSPDWNVCCFIITQCTHV